MLTPGQLLHKEQKNAVSTSHMAGNSIECSPFKTMLVIKMIMYNVIIERQMVQLTKKKKELSTSEWGGRKVAYKKDGRVIGKWYIHRYTDLALDWSVLVPVDFEFCDSRTGRQDISL